ncbi:MAG: hypothetical protein H6Q60_403 [Oscillospiraceae bacterium]|nr:hypothetical protein [Oscillospiraceae bacterium]
MTEFYPSAANKARSDGRRFSGTWFFLPIGVFLAIIALRFEVMGGFGVRAMITDGQDGTLVVLTVESLLYDKEDEIMYVNGTERDFSIGGMPEPDYRQLAAELFQNGMVDLSRYEAEEE